MCGIETYFLVFYIRGALPENQNPVFQNAKIFKICYFKFILFKISYISASCDTKFKI